MVVERRPEDYDFEKMDKGKYMVHWKGITFVLYCKEEELETEIIKRIELIKKEKGNLR